MLKFSLLMSLAVLLVDVDAGSPDGGLSSPRDSGLSSTSVVPVHADAGTVIPRPSGLPHPDGGVAIQWPNEFQPLATLDGPAVVAANAALQRVLARFPKGHTGDCSYSPKSLEVSVGYESGLYFVQIDRRVDKCGWTNARSLEFDWFELYAVTPDGKVLERYPYHP